MFFDGDPNRKGVCDKGGGQVAWRKGSCSCCPGTTLPLQQKFSLPWRFCQNCFGDLIQQSQQQGLVCRQQQPHRTGLHVDSAAP